MTSDLVLMLAQQVVGEASEALSVIHMEPCDEKKGPVVGLGLRALLGFLPTSSGRMKVIPQVALGGPTDSNIQQEELL